MSHTTSRAHPYRGDSAGARAFAFRRAKATRGRWADTPVRSTRSTNAKGLSHAGKERYHPGTIQRGYELHRYQLSPSTNNLIGSSSTVEPMSPDRRRGGIMEAAASYILCSLVSTSLIPAPAPMNHQIDTDRFNH
ncbi:jg15753 [Pararge aegeria aegeria]|uniref:Jg15753 protein n=1 Tax=Pararge aegeria aegeria TaxID=348720 RepID=A0A8S4RMA0_9NEOP|nr:jg15753 [Pararge aegeria aegeria]